MRFGLIQRSMLACLWLCAGCNLVPSSGSDGSGGSGGDCQGQATALDMPEQIVETKRQIQKEMTAEAKAAGIEIDPDSLVNASGNGATVVAAVRAGLAKVAPSSLVKGVDMGFLYLDLPHDSGGVQPDLPAGYYTLRASAPQKILEAALAATGGKEPDPAATDKAPYVDGAKVELVGSDGKVAATLPGSLSVWSLDVAADAAKTPPTVETVSGARIVRMWFRCSNGSIVCVTIVWNDKHSYL